MQWTCHPGGLRVNFVSSAETDVGGGGAYWHPQQRDRVLVMLPGVDY